MRDVTSLATYPRSTFPANYGRGDYANRRVKTTSTPIVDHSLAIFTPRRNARAKNQKKKTGKERKTSDSVPHVAVRVNFSMGTAVG